MRTQQAVVPAAVLIALGTEIPQCTSPQVQKCAVDVALLLSEFKHVVISFVCHQDDKRLYIVLEYVVGGELFSHLRKAGKFPNDVAKFYAAEVILAFEYIHSMDILYRDLKPENLLLDVGGHIKITDFGFAKKVLSATCSSRLAAAT